MDKLFLELLRLRIDMNKTEKPFSLQDDKKTDKTDMNFETKRQLD